MLGLKAQLHNLMPSEKDKEATYVDMPNKHPMCVLCHVVN